MFDSGAANGALPFTDPSYKDLSTPGPAWSDFDLQHVSDDISEPIMWSAQLLNSAFGSSFHRDSNAF